ncbi:DUF4242 domain-containing protein [Pseudoxanthomonas sp. F11]|jgi:hypothetical protein|uniref:DUF4242 domain-containing protein n=1 Tax=Pseudoxanthomonas mexicana TaxID=128785 RepID=A0ABX6RBQ0_PSEMX|nr:DUF4242 domain-containing protein [Pseudoxanthomonas mexicana]MCA0298047.1 DUF4242 domain-containing protein [Pseudomonadota bacterium]QLQ29665.1 MAG: DUF4242 domain-containing protein [Pseudoxanthomonas sp.]MCP1584569.1 hypothetical protein [Pseudoxanthomonas mexicana]QND80456.1 DUF4242 domain-containing protein [Pseudoxanthomonas mexicana]UOV01256.1 DUF4242 domain-containing protein [Pseudoxanthomonas mexicana]
MPRYLIERDIQGAGLMTPAELRSVSQTSCRVLDDLGPQIQWEHSYVTDDRIYCVYRAPNEDIVLEHARRGGFPVDRISVVAQVIDPLTAE